MYKSGGQNRTSMLGVLLSAPGLMSPLGGGTGLSALNAIHLTVGRGGLALHTYTKQIAIISQQIGINKGPKVQQHHNVIIMHQNRILTNLCQMRTKFNQIMAKCLPETKKLTGFDKVPTVLILGATSHHWNFLGIS